MLFFFQIFLGVVIFGLYHGLIYLPVLLSLIGPKSHSSTSLPSPEADDGSSNSFEMSKTELQMPKKLIGRSSSNTSSDSSETKFDMDKTDFLRSDDSDYATKSETSDTSSKEDVNNSHSSCLSSCSDVSIEKK